MEKNYSFAGRRSATNSSTRFDLRKGKFSRWIGHDSPREEFDFVQGKLKGIRLRQNETAGGEMTFMDVHFEAGDQRFTVSTIASSSVTAELVSKLVNIRDLESEIRIDVWAKDNYTNCVVRENGEKLPFRFLPKAERKQSGFTTTIDSSERDAAVMEMVTELNNRLGYAK